MKIGMEEDRLVFTPEDEEDSGLLRLMADAVGRQNWEEMQVTFFQHPVREVSGFSLPRGCVQGTPE